MQPFQCPEGVFAGALITKEQRRSAFGIVAGGSGSMQPEKDQRLKIVEGTGVLCPKTNFRINLRTNTLKEIAKPNLNDDGFDYSEDFDGAQSWDDKRVFLNMKSVVGRGGAQTRSLREVYWFIEGQLRVLKNSDSANIYFANILDGDESNRFMSKFNYLLALPEFDIVRNRVYVGDLKGYFDWVNAVVSSV